MKYQEAIKYLCKQLPMYQRIGPAAYKSNLDNTLALDRLFGHPHNNFKSVHIAGTNGKGSVSHMLASVLQCAGYKVGLYTSPHLKDYRERIRVNGIMITKDAVCHFLEKFLLLNEKEGIEPSFFELTVMMAFDYFSAQKVDWAVVEVGLGGRLDSTNIISPELSVITNISLDHTALLGKTLPEIAAEKAGIIKTDTPVVIGETQNEVRDVFIQKANKMNAPLIFADQNYLLTPSANETFIVSTQYSLIYSELRPDLKGEYQSKNLVTAIAAIEQLKRSGVSLNAQHVVTGLSGVMKNTGLRGRWQHIGEKPEIICDSGHNEAGIKWVAGQLKHLKYKQLHIVFGMVKDKDINAILKLLPTNAVYYFTQAGIERAMDANKLKALAVDSNLKGEAYATVREALAAAKNNAGENDLIFIGGSTFVIAEIL